MDLDAWKSAVHYHAYWFQTQTEVGVSTADALQSTCRRILDQTVTNERLSSSDCYQVAVIVYALHEKRNILTTGGWTTFHTFLRDLRAFGLRFDTLESEAFSNDLAALAELFKAIGRTEIPTMTAQELITRQAPVWVYDKSTIVVSSPLMLPPSEQVPGEKLAVWTDSTVMTMAARLGYQCPWLCPNDDRPSSKFQKSILLGHWHIQDHLQNKHDLTTYKFATISLAHKQYRVSDSECRGPDIVWKLVEDV